MADTTVADINIMTKDGNGSTGAYLRSHTAASDGTAVGSADVAVIPDWRSATDTILVECSTATPLSVEVETNRDGRTNAMTVNLVTTSMCIIPAGTIPEEIFRQPDGSLRLSVTGGTFYVTVLRVR